MQFFKSNWFLFVLTACLVGGYALAAPLSPLASIPWLKWAIVAVTMVAMTWPLKTNALLGAAKKPLPSIIATVINMVIAPLLAWPFSKLLDQEMSTGLILAAAVPSTLASAAVWTRRAGGNDSIAMMVTVITNSICFLVTPSWIFWILGDQISGFSASEIISKLLMFVVVPMAVGQALRGPPGSADWATSKKPTFSLFAQFGILAMVLLGSIRLGNSVHLESTTVNLNQILLVVVLVSGLHLILFFIGILAGRATNLSMADQIAIGFAGSQKTLMVGLGVAVSMGLNIIPIVAYHAMQLIIDTLIADRYRIVNSTETDNQNRTL